MRRKKILTSRISFDGCRFPVADIPLKEFHKLGRQHRDKSTVHSIFLRKAALSDCYIQPKQQISGYCSYSLVSCDSSIVGVAFFSYAERTKMTRNSLVVARQVYSDTPQEDEVFQPLITLEKLDLYLFVSNYGSAIVIPTVLKDTKYLVSVG